MSNLKKYDFFVPIYMDGLVTFQELRKEFQPENNAPVLILKHGDEIIIPLFRDPTICLNFIRRNTPKYHIVGVMGMSEVDTKKFTERGWNIDWHTYPKLYTSRPGYEISVEVIESDFDLFTAGKR